jgi:hypothetical protein
MKYQVTRIIHETGIRPDVITEQFRSIGSAINAYDHYRQIYMSYDGVKCAEQFIADKKAIFWASKNGLNARIIFEVVAE